jgi:hypothetical protein
MTDTYEETPEPITAESLREQEARIAHMRRQLAEQHEAATANDPDEQLRRRVVGTLQRGDAPSKGDVWQFSGMRIREAAQAARDEPSYSAVEYTRGGPMPSAKTDARGPRRRR